MKTYEDLGIYDLRAIAREMGVKSPTTLKRNELINAIEEIKNKKVEPYHKKTKKGRPYKSRIKLVNVFEYATKEEQKRVEIEIIKKYKNLFLLIKDFNEKVNIFIEEYLNKIEDILK